MIAMKIRLFTQLKAPCRGLAQQTLIAGCCILASVPDATAGPREQAKRIHDRLTGVPPTEAVLLNMAADISSGDVASAANTAMQNEAFYSVTLKNMATPWTNREQSSFEPLNDYVATVIGAVRDNLDFRRILWDDIIYVGTAAGLPGYSNSNNAHYEQFESSGASYITDLEQRPQSAVTGLPSNATSGVITSRAATKAFFIAGTNRAMFRFTLMNHYCRDLEQVHDVTRPPDRIRKDVSRSPGGDSRFYSNNCLGCHAGLDPLSQAYAYYNYVDPDDNLNTDDGSLQYTPGVVQKKNLINPANFPYGYETPDDHWDNYWREGINQHLGWDPALPGSGDGLKSMSIEMAQAEAFAQCQVTKVFRKICLREPENAADHSQISTMLTNFKNQNYNLKTVFSDSAEYCMGD